MIEFIKMHGTSNDFVIIDCRQKDYKKLINFKQIANRKTGIGCDQVITLHNSNNADCFMRIYNADGSEVEMCGNAARCVGYLMMQEKKLDNTFIELTDRILKCKQIKQNVVQVDMGQPTWKWQEIPTKEECNTLFIPIELEILKNPVGVNIGNTHAVFFVDSIKDIPLKRLGPILENHSLFPKKSNIEIAQVISREQIALRVWERGVGETDSCGSGACATLVASVLRKYTEKEVLVKLPGGDLLIKWENNNHITMSGEISYVFSGKYILDYCKFY